MRDNVAVVIEQEDDAALVLVDAAAERLLQVLHLDILGHDPFHMLVLVADGLRDREDLLVVRLAEIRPGNSDKPVVAGRFQVPVLGAEFGDSPVEGVSAGADVFAIRRAEIDVKMLVAVVLQVLL